MDFLWIFGCFESVSLMFCLKLLLILILLNAVLSKVTFGSMFVSSDDVLCIKEIHRLGPMDLKIYTLAKTTVIVTQQLTKSYCRQNYLCDFYLRTQKIRNLGPYSFGKPNSLSLKGEYS
jgi:hypothetical protein